MSSASSSVSEVVASNSGGREFWSDAVLNRVTGDSQLHNYIGVSPSSDAGYTGIVDSVDVCFDGPITDRGYSVRFYLSVVNSQNPSVVFETLDYFRIHLVNAERPVFVSFRKPLNFVCPPGYFLCCHYYVLNDQSSFLSTANVKWRSYSVV